MDRAAALSRGLEPAQNFSFLFNWREQKVMDSNQNTLHSINPVVKIAPLSSSSFNIGDMFVRLTGKPISPPCQSKVPQLPAHSITRNAG